MDIMFSFAGQTIGPVDFVNHKFPLCTLSLLSLIPNNLISDALNLLFYDDDDDNNFDDYVIMMMTTMVMISGDDD